MTSRHLGLLAAVIALAATPALGGCGGDDETSAGEQWAGSVCSELSTWVTSVETAITSLTDNPLSLDKEAVQAATTDVKGATDKLVDGLAALGPPETEAGSQAKSELDSLGTQLQQQLDEVQQETDAGSLSIVTVTLWAFAAASCATAMSVSSHVEPGLDLSRYRTFEWGPADALPTGDARLDGNPFFKDHVQGAVEKGLAARGLELTSAESPDLLIHYHANITKRINVNHTDRAYGYCSRGDCPPGIVDYDAGTLVLDIVDARTNTLIWRGWAQNSVEDVLDNPDRMARTIDQAVARMLFRLPPKL